MKALLWVIVVLIIGIAGFIIYESQSSSTVPIPATIATTTAATLPDIIPGTPSVMYVDPTYGFSIYYPSTTILKTTGFDGYLMLTQSPVIGLALDPDLFQGTNLTEAGVYIGATTTPSIVAGCTEPANAMETEASSTASINGATFAVFDSTGVGAGNIYQEKAFRTVEAGTCFEIVELLHSGQLANYPSGTVTAFDQTRFSGILDAMVNTFTFK